MRHLSESNRRPQTSPSSTIACLAPYTLIRHPHSPIALSIDNVASNDGTPGSHELNTTPPRPDLHSLLSAPRTSSAITLSFIVARIRYCPRLQSAASSQTSAMPCLKCFISLFGFSSSSLPLAVHFVCVIGPCLSLLLKLSFGFCCHPIRDRWSTICIIVSYLFIILPRVVVLFGFWCLSCSLQSSSTLCMSSFNYETDKSD